MAGSCLRKSASSSGESRFASRSATVHRTFRDWSRFLTSWVRITSYNVCYTKLLRSLARQYEEEGVAFSAQDLPANALVPRALFDSVADNLIRNALAKRDTSIGLRVRVELRCGEKVELRVCDTGAAVPEDVARDLFRGPIPSKRGMGRNNFV